MAQKPERQRSAASLPLDRFDEPGLKRVGSHRITGRARSAWRYVVIGAVATAVLVAGGILWITLIGGGVSQTPASEPPPASEPQVTAELDPSALVAVINGTEVPNRAAGVDRVITQNGWGSIVFSGDAETRDVPISAVFYADDADQAAAAGLAAQLGGMSTYKSDSYGEYGARLIVLIGSDYAGPGDAEAAEITAQLDGMAAATDENVDPVE